MPMGLLDQKYRIFVYDPNLDEGAYKPLCDLWASSQRNALEKLQAQTSDKLTIVEKGEYTAANSPQFQFIARLCSKPETWPSVDSGRLPRSENRAKQEDFERGRLA
jgi:hypothetical protein